MVQLILAALLLVVGTAAAQAQTGVVVKEGAKRAAPYVEKYLSRALKGGGAATKEVTTGGKGIDSSGADWLLKQAGKKGLKLGIDKACESYDCKK